MSGKTIFVARVKDPRGMFHCFVKERKYYIVAPKDFIKLPVLKEEYPFRLADSFRNGHSIIILFEDESAPRLFMRLANDSGWEDGGHPRYYLHLIDHLGAFH